MPHGYAVPPASSGHTTPQPDDRAWPGYDTDPPWDSRGRLGTSSSCLLDDPAHAAAFVRDVDNRLRVRRPGSGSEDSPNPDDASEDG